MAAIDTPTSRDNRERPSDQTDGPSGRAGPELVRRTRTTAMAVVVGPASAQQPHSATSTSADDDLRPWTARGSCCRIDDEKDAKGVPP